MQPQGASGIAKTIALFLHDIDDTVGFRTYHGVSQRVSELGLNLYCFIQGTRTEPEFTNLCTEMAGTHCDGVICGISSRTSLMESKKLQEYFEGFKLPIVSISDLWSGIPCISFDNYQGMREALTHLIEHHGKRRIFLIRGPLEHYDANRRYQAYMDVMQEFGLFDPALVSSPADWTPNKNETIGQLFGLLQPGTDFDAVMSSNDNWAIEAINYLQRMGYEIPDDLAVVGFNDSPEGQNTTPPLTSVQLSFFEKGRKAVDVLMELMNGTIVPGQAELVPRLEIRQSCGCLDSDFVFFKLLDEYRGEQVRSSEPGNTEAVIIEYIRQFFQDEDLEMVLPYIEPIVKTINSFKREGAADKFLWLVNKAARKSITQNQDVIVWWNVLEVLLQWRMNGLPPEELCILERLFKKAQAMIGFGMMEKIKSQVIDNKRSFWHYHLLIHSMIQILNLKELVAFLVRDLPQFGFYSVFLVLFNEVEQPFIYPGPKPALSRLILAYNGSQPERCQTNPQTFPAEEFLPNSILHSMPFNLIVTPLYDRENQFGYFICDYRETSPLPYKMLWPQLRSAIKGIYNFEQRKKAEELLEIQKEELARSNNELQQFASIASHDLQEPLRKIITFGGRLRSSFPELLTEQARDYLDRIENAAVRMQSLINGLLNYSRVTTKAQPFSQVDLENIAQEVLADIEVKILETKAQIKTASLPVIEADPLQMRQLFQNMISNAIKFQKIDTIPVINVMGEIEGENILKLIFEDNGIGIDPVHYDRIFMVFERLHSRSEYEGTGVGLAICKKIVDRHNGTIRIENAFESGTRFIVRLPILQNSKTPNE